MNSLKMINYELCMHEIMQGSFGRVVFRHWPFPGILIYIFQGAILVPVVNSGPAEHRYTVSLQTV